MPEILISPKPNKSRKNPACGGLGSLIPPWSNKSILKYRKKNENITGFLYFFWGRGG
jgi:hypothetical protein